MDLKELRNKINEIDEELLSLYLKRMDISKQIGQYKKEHNLPIYDSKREEELINYLLNKINNNELKEQILQISGVNARKCMRCGKCTATCPSFDNMEYHPHQFVYMVESGNIEPLLNSKSLYTCLSCFACVERCPRGVEPAKIVEATRLAVIREQGANHLKPQDIPEILDDDLPQQAIVSAFRKYTK